MFRTIVRLALVVVVAHAALKTVPVFWTYVKFRDAVKEMAMFSAKQTDREVLERVLQIANRMDVPLARENVRVRKEQNVTVVDASYTAQLEYFPRQYYPWQFTFQVRAQPPAYTQLLP